MRAIRLQLTLIPSGRRMRSLVIERREFDANVSYISLGFRVLKRGPYLRALSSNTDVILAQQTIWQA